MGFKKNSHYKITILFSLATIRNKIRWFSGFRLYDLSKVKAKDIFETKDNNYNFFWQSAFLLEYKNTKYLKFH